MKKQFLVAACCALPALAGAQSVGPATLNAAGGSATISGNTYEWSVGQTSPVSTYTGPGLVVTQGVLQPSLRSTGVGSVPSNPLSLKVYPNPVSEGQLYLQPAFAAGGSLSYDLLDAAGKTVLRGRAQLTTGNELQTVDVAALAAGHYSLSVRWQGSGQPLQSTYQIQKVR